MVAEAYLTTVNFRVYTLARILEIRSSMKTVTVISQKAGLGSQPLLGICAAGLGIQG